MKSLKFIIASMILISCSSCSDNKKENIKGAKEENKLTEFTGSSSVNTEILEQLDKTLSPFEDMTELALNKNEAGIQKTLDHILKSKDVFKNNISLENLVDLNLKLKTLQNLVKTKQYQKLALLSSELFDFNTTHFIEGDKIENQIKIEHLDYLGFQTLSLLDQDEIDWKSLATTITNVENIWESLSENVNDSNLKDSFDYLFEGFHESAKNKDEKMATILAKMDLSLVDVLENTFE